MSNQKTIVAFLVLLIPSGASASILYSKGIFVQEYWQDGKLFYAVGNANDDDLTINVLDDEGDILAGPWKIAARSTGTFALDTPRETKWVHFRRKNGSVIGALRAPQPLKFEKPAMTGMVRSVNGLNGSGGRREDVCVEQSATTYKPGSVIDITVILPSDNSVITFTRKAPSHPYPWPRKIQRLEIIDAKSETLPIFSDDEKIETDVGSAIREQPHHKLNLRFRVPKVDSPQMLNIEGWRRFAPGISGHTIARGILVDPNLK